MDKIVVQMVLQARVGAFVKERKKKQPVLLAITVLRNLRGVNDLLEKTIDYRKIYAAAKKEVEAREYRLVESLAEAVASSVKRLGASCVVVRVHKPRVFPKAWVEIER